MRRKNMCHIDCVYDERPCSYPSWAYLVSPGHLTSVHVGNGTTVILRLNDL